MRPRLRAFTLVELLVVVLIIALVIAIVVPTLGAARNTARSASTQSLMNELVQAITQFELDENRAPGYFDATEMGAATNLTQGFTSMENIMLDLAGGVVDPGSSEPTGLLQVGPGVQAFVNPDLIGVPGSSKLYFTPKGKSYVAQNGQGVGGDQAGSDDNKDLPDLVDAFGNPLLAWAANPTALSLQAQADFAQISYTSGVNPARYYWAANSGFLSTSQLGKGSRDQRKVAGEAWYSMIGSGVSDQDRVASMIGLLGSPSYPQQDSGAGGGRGGLLPAATRGNVLIQSAGPDGYFLASKDAGAKQFSGTAIQYERNFKTADGSGYTDRNGKATNIDVIEAFDDMTASTGN